MEMNDAQLDFLNHYLDYIQTHYPPRYMRGVKKYKTTISEDYSAEELIDNNLEELLDAFAYSLASLKKIERLNARISELENEIVRLKDERS